MRQREHERLREAETSMFEPPNYQNPCILRQCIIKKDETLSNMMCYDAACLFIAGLPVRLDVKHDVCPACLFMYFVLSLLN